MCLRLCAYKSYRVQGATLALLYPFSAHRANHLTAKLDGCLVSPLCMLHAIV